MSAPPIPSRVLFSPDGQKWAPHSGVGPVVKMVIGTPPRSGERVESVRLSRDVRQDLQQHLASVTHLYLWRIEDLSELPPLPPGLRCLDVRGCSALENLPALPGGLETLVIEGCSQVSTLVVPPGGFSALEDLSLKGGVAMTDAPVNRLLAASPKLRRFDASECPKIRSIHQWPPLLDRIDLNGCANLTALPADWPPALRRLGLRGAAALTELGPMPASLDYLDLAYAKRLKQLPEFNGRPRTLFVFDSGLEIPNELFGASDEFNAAASVFAHLGEANRVVDHEVKVILLGDGRSGKSSLARRLVEKQFNLREESTHGIRLWELKLPFEPVDEAGVQATAKLNLWDFAGQDLYHNTHRLFFQSKAIFLLCANCCPDGADADTDRTEDSEREAHADIRRHLRYWRQQVESLGQAPGMDGPPPILVVRTKVDRDEENPAYAAEFERKRRADAGELDHLEFSSRDSTGVRQLNEWLSRQVARVLGPRGKREIGVNPMRVKTELALRMEVNQAVHRLNEQTGQQAKPPHPLIARDGEDGFDALVRRLCPSGDYHQSPGLLLERLHLSGFLYYNQQFLPDSVVLDQRWAIAGMYSAFDRRTAWPHLLAARGRFTAADLASWNWDRSGVSPAEQGLFLQFMQSCGMIFRLGSIGEGQDEFLAPGALPEGGAGTEREAADHRAGLAQVGPPVVLEHPGLSRESVLQLLVELGREWRRAPVLWRWGGQFQSYRRHEWNWQGPLTFVHLDWRELDSESYGGRLILTQYGPDASFLAAILNECRPLSGFRGVEIPSIPVPVEIEDTIPQPRSEARPPDRKKSHGPDSPHADAVQIGISFAGDQSGPVKHWSELPDDSIEKWPLALAAELRARQFKVEEYRTQQQRAEHDKFQGRRPYLDHLVTRDFLIPFLSWAYLESQWCMFEFLRIHQRMEGGIQNPAKVRVASFKEATFSQTVRREHPVSRLSFEAHFRKHWKEWLVEVEKLVVENAEPRKQRETDFQVYGKQLGELACKEWVQCVRDEEGFDAILRAIKGDWTILPIDPAPEIEVVQRWVAEIAENTGRREVLLDFAATAFSAEERERAQRLFVGAYLVGESKDVKETLRTKIGNPALDDIRRELLEIYEGQPVDAAINDWKDLAKRVNGS